MLDGSFRPEPMKPVVFHLHGWLGIPESLVLTEDDYLDFLVAVSRDERSLLSHEVHLASTSSLFSSSVIRLGTGISASFSAAS